MAIVKHGDNGNCKQGVAWDGCWCDANHPRWLPGCQQAILNGGKLPCNLSPEKILVAVVPVSVPPARKAVWEQRRWEYVPCQGLGCTNLVTKRAVSGLCRTCFSKQPWGRSPDRARFRVHDAQHYKACANPRCGNRAARSSASGLCRQCWEKTAMGRV